MNEFIHEITENIYFIQGQRNGRYPYSHSLLIKDFLCDTGISSGFLRKLKRKHPINHVLLSHWHEDHIAGNRLLPDATFYCHESDREVIEDVQKMYEYYFVDKDPNQVELFDTILGSLRLEDTNVDILVQDRDKIKVDDEIEIEVIHTPGHSAGHLCFIETKSMTAFLADIDLSSFGPWYAGIDSNLMEFEDSIKKMLALDLETVVTSHKGMVTGKSSIKEALKDYLKTIHDRDDNILSELDQNSPKTAEDLASKNLIYKYYTEYETYEKMAENKMISYHFDKLLKEGKILEVDGKGFLLQ